MKSIGFALGFLLMGYTAGWIDAARDTVDALNTSTTLAWKEYAQQGEVECVAIAMRCAKEQAELKACTEYTECLGGIKAVAQAVVGFHRLVEQARQVFDALDGDRDNEAYAIKARQLWRLALKQASAIADALARHGVPMDVRQ